MGRISGARKRNLELSKKGAAARRKSTSDSDSNSVEDSAESPTTKNRHPKGRRLLSVTSLILAIQAICQHGTVCSIFDVAFANEQKCGVQTTLSFVCDCAFQVNVSSDSGDESVSANRALSMGCQIAPVGYSAVATLLTVLDIPSPSKDLHGKCQQRTFEDVVNAVQKLMNAAGEEEKRLAVEAGYFVEITETLENGEQIKVKYPCIMVIVDGGWCTRTYGHSYNANSGTAVVIGARTRKVLSIKTMNKTCQICTMARNKDKEPYEHQCFKNWDGPSTGMEAAMLYQSFDESRKVHGLVYNRFVGDGDSSVYSKIINIYPGMVVEKIECLNHAMKNFHKKLVNISANHVPGIEIPNSERRIPGLKDRFNRIGGAIMCAINHHAENRDEHSWKGLRQDIMNSVSHIFGEHGQCKTYFCPVDGIRREESNLVPEMETKIFWSELQKAVSRLANLSRSLIERMTTNAAESFMSICNRYMEGKRKNLSQRMLYNLLIKGFWGVEAYQALFGRIPSELWQKKRLESINQRTRLIMRRNRRRPSFLFLKPRRGDSDYGSYPNRPDISDEELQVCISDLRSRCFLDSQRQVYIEEATENQADNNLWFDERRKRVTASVCGEIVKRRPSTNNTNLLNKMLRKSRSTIAMKYGKDNERFAREAYTLYKGHENDLVQPAGLIVSVEEGIFAASPDAFVGNDGILEIKCPYSCRDGSATEWEPIKNKEGSPMLKRNHNYFYQVIMLHTVTVTCNKEGLVRFLRLDTSLHSLRKNF